MNQFCRAHCVSAKNKEITTYIVFGKGQEPILTEELLMENNQFREFFHDYKPKVAYVNYETYRTDKEVYGALYPEQFEEIIEKDSMFYSRGEVTVYRRKPASKKKKKSPIKTVAIGAMAAAATGFLGLGAGYKLFGGKVVVQQQTAPAPVVAADEDGMIIPEQTPIEANKEQITVSIDRSYLAVPTEDLELKGAITRGKASITLPEFDREDFFTHVFGYSFGFSTDPEGKKIEYYGGQTYEFTEDTKLYRVLVKYGGGSGTKEDPYLINYYDQLELLAQEGARGYFKQTENIVFPAYASHTPINTKNELKADPESEHFEYDGNGYCIDCLNAPLFGTVSGAEIKNVNVRQAVIRTDLYNDYGAIVCNAYNYQYKTEKDSYKTGETLIKHCTVSHTSITLESMSEAPTETPIETPTEAPQLEAPEVVPPDLIGYDEKGNAIEPTTEEAIKPTKTGEYSIGGISGNGGQIEDCYVTDFGVYINLPNYILNVGGISGKPANVINSVVFFYSAQGNIFNAGGIAGSAAGTRTYDAQGRELPECYGGNIQGCVVRGVTLNSELNAGGIAGVGGSDAANALISNSYANALAIECGEYETVNDQKILIKAGNAGGVIGSDNTLKNGHLITNTVSVAELPVIGKKDKSKYDDTVRMAPAYAFYQNNIVSVLNKNTINPDKPKEIFTGIFTFDGGLFGDENGALCYPKTIEDLFNKTITGG